MKRDALGKGRFIFFAMIIAATLLSVPALAGNSVTITGDLIPSFPPVADFSADPTSGTAPLLVHFTDMSTGVITDYAWDFDNDGTVDSMLQNPTFTYDIPGNYAVSLTVTGPGGSDSEGKTGYITVKGPAPVAAFSSTPTSGTAPFTVQFTDESTNSPLSWRWEYRKGLGSWIMFSAEQNPAHTFPDAGIYSIRLTVTNEGGSDTLTKPICFTVLPSQPIALFTQDKYLGRAPLEVKFSDRSLNEPTSWYWQFGDGETSTDQNPAHIYTRDGVYTVRLRASNAGGSTTAYGIVIVLRNWWW